MDAPRTVEVSPSNAQHGATTDNPAHGATAGALPNGESAARSAEQKVDDGAPVPRQGAGERQQDAGHGARKWQPYEDAAHPWLRKWFGARWSVMSFWPLQHRMVPSYHFTVGECLLALLCVAGAAGGMAVMGLDDVEGSGGGAVLPLLGAFATVNHNSVWTLLLGIPFERALAWHKFFAYLSVIVGAWHGAAAVNVEGWDFGNTEFLSGVILWGGMALLILTSLNPIRRALFEVFMYLHVILFAITLIFGLAHGAGGIIFGFGLYGLDVVFRYLYLAGRRNPKEVTISRLPGNVVRISFPKGNFRYKAGQYVFVNIPSLSLFQWHPFSLSSSPYQDTVMVHIRVLGNWTKALYDMAAKRGKPMQVKAYLEGCYGEPGVDVEGDKYDLFLLVSGGIGITPMQSIANELLEQTSAGVHCASSGSCGRYVACCRHAIALLSACGGAYSYIVADTNDAPDTRMGEQVRHVDMVGGMLHWDQGLSVERTMPLEFSPDLLVRHSSSISYQHMDVDGASGQVGAAASHPPPAQDTDDPLHCDYHLTRVKSLAELPEGSNIKPAVQECLRFGRPNLPQVFAHMHGFAKRQQGDGHAAPRVAVLACGPAGMLNQVKKLCWSASGDGVSFDFHGETFDF